MSPHRVPLHAALAAFCLAAAPCVTPPVAAQAVWSKRSAQVSPEGTTDLAMAFDPKNGNVVLFGNRRRAETWLWDGVAWKLAATSGPRPWSTQMVYDSTNGRILLVSGEPGSGAFETWAWDGASWRRLTISGAPRGRHGFGLAHDAGRKVTVLFGGAWGGNELADTWEFDGSSWRQRSTGGPLPRMDMELAYDAARAEVVMFGGQRNSSPSTRYADTWVWDGRVWFEHFGIGGPSRRVFASMAFDHKRGRMVLSGGTDLTGAYFDDTWEWDGKTWAQINPTVRPPKKSWFGAMAYDSTRDVIVYHLGNSNSSETWEYTNRSLPKATYASFGKGCAGSTGVPLLAAGTGQLPRLGQRFDLELTNLANGAFVRAFGVIGVSDTRWMNLSLPLDLNIVGAPGCRLLVSMDLMQNLTIANRKASWSFQVPNDPTLAGGPFFLQALVFEPGVNALGAVLSNGGAGQLGM